MTVNKNGRYGQIQRKTRETSIEIEVNLDGTGQADIDTNHGFFDHMLDHIARHGLLDMRVHVDGDLQVDPHHTVEDTGICLGQALLQALGSPKGITRYANAVVPMDEALAEASIDISGRPFLVFRGDLPVGSPGGFDAELGEEFFRAIAVASRMTLHMELRYGKNLHHCLEALFKAFGRALRRAVEMDPRVTDVPSTKGMLEL
ncbi:MAG: imidazoleglycerol-phosphate dehydratase HisB [Candidatus Hydrogenedens sp.]|jgi:imidazoleglycerol-phosphate dehydratase|nr:imidazoleglycerol-phosphate dehydratase HisB [Candidatus Hydrogenedens sp.]